MPMAMTKRYTTVNGQIMFAEQVSEPGKSIALVPDTLGNVIANKDVNGDIVRTCEYWPYGEIRTDSDSNPTPFGYGGTWGYYTDSSGLLYVRARTYKPVEGRWLTVDPLWPGESAYGYCEGDPVEQSDYQGTAPSPCTPVEKMTCQFDCMLKLKETMCKRWTWKCFAREIWICNILVSRTLDCDCTCKQCKNPPADKTEYHSANSKPHYFKSLGCCCYGGHTHIIKYHVSPPPLCKVNANRVDGICFGDCRPGPCN